MTYTIRKGDTLSALARRNKTTVQALAKLNGIADPNKIRAGASLKLPTPSINTAPKIKPPPPKSPGPTGMPRPVDPGIDPGWTKGLKPNPGAGVPSSKPASSGPKLNPTLEPSPKDPSRGVRMGPGPIQPITKIPGGVALSKRAK